MSVIAFVNNKGGVSKTSSTHNIGAGLAQRGYRVLMIDLDSQCSLSSVARANRGGITILEVLTRRANISQAIQHAGGFDIVPGSEGLAAEGILVATGKEYRLKESLQSLQRSYDYILLDCPPSLGVLTVNALTAADGIIIPCQPDFFSYEALHQIKPTVETIRQYTNPGLKIRGILITRYSRSILSREAVEMIEEFAKEMGTKVYRSMIRENVSVKESQATRQDVLTYSPRSNGTTDYNHVIDEIIEEG